MSYYGLTKIGPNQVKYSGPINETNLEGKNAGDVINKVFDKAPSSHLLFVPSLGIVIAIRSSNDFQASHFKSPINEEVAADILATCARKGKKINIVENFGAYEILGERKETEHRLTYVALFDRKKYGINFYFGAGFFLASIISWFSWPIVILLIGHKPILPPFGQFVDFFIMALLYSTSFLFVSHLVRKNLLLPFIWGLCRVILGIFDRGVIRSLFVKSQEISNLGHVFDLNIMVISFICAFLYMAAIILSIYYWKIKPWSLIIGITIADIISQIIACIILKDISFSLSDILFAVISGIIDGVLLYAGFALHFRKKSIEQLPSTN